MDNSIILGPISNEYVNASILTRSLKTALAYGVSIRLVMLNVFGVGFVSRRKSFKESNTLLLISIVGAPF